MKLNFGECYVIVEHWLYSGVTCDDTMYTSESEAREALAARSLQLHEANCHCRVVLMSLVDYISAYGTERYDEGYNEGSNRDG